MSDLQLVCEILGVPFTAAQRFLPQRWMAAYDCAVSLKRLWDAYVVFYFGYLSKEEQDEYLSVVVNIYRKHNVSFASRDEIRSIWRCHDSKYLTEDGMKRKLTIVTGLFFCHPHKVGDEHI